MFFVFWNFGIQFFNLVQIPLIHFTIEDITRVLVGFVPKKNPWKSYDLAGTFISLSRLSLSHLFCQAKFACSFYKVSVIIPNDAFQKLLEPLAVFSFQMKLCLTVPYYPTSVH